MARTQLGMFLTLILFTCAMADEPRLHNDPIDSYQKMTIAGWEVLVSGRYAGHDDLRDQVLDEVRCQLHRARLILPDKPLEAMRRVKIFVEYDYPHRTQYHPNRQWLIAHGYIPEKTGTIEIANAKNILSWRKTPINSLLHELFHAYHDQVLGFDEARIKAAYDVATASGKYDKVMLQNGDTVKHYAMTDHKEFFAELSESFFWVNDFYPFNRAELRQYDPETFKLLRDIWGQ
ncbi:metallopeptidase [Planctomycetales bacterium ZRK34]|nr:metallopeptidase [Planctomycetales bacterium ZRK34]